MASNHPDVVREGQGGKKGKNKKKRHPVSTFTPKPSLPRRQIMK
jgi:hypothetical protein